MYTTILSAYDTLIKKIYVYMVQEAHNGNDMITENIYIQTLHEPHYTLCI